MFAVSGTFQHIFQTIAVRANIVMQQHGAPRDPYKDTKIRDCEWPVCVNFS